MSRSFQSEWMKDILESIPSLVFLVLLRANVDLETAGWAGTALAAAVLAGFRIYRMRFNPILLGINIHQVVVTPFVVAVFHLGAPEIGEVLAAYSYKAVLITIFLVGCALTLLSREGFVGFEGLPRSTVRSYSAVLLAASLAAILWAFTYSNGALFSIALPIMGLFGLRRFLIARVLDANRKLNGIGAVTCGETLTFNSSSES